MTDIPNITIADGVDMPQLGFGVWQVPDADAANIVQTAIAAGYRSIDIGGDVSIPQLGFGVFQIPDDDVERAVLQAFELGYRPIDTAAIYRNERGVGEAIKAAGIARSDLFVTTKLWNDRHADPRAALEESLEKLGLEHVDLYLIHWPTTADTFVDAWRRVAALRDEGLARAIGVCNFQIHHLERIGDDTGLIPAVNQIELHPYLQQAALRRYHVEHGITTEAWSPIGQGKGLLDDPALAPIAAKHGRTPAQVVIRWHLQLDNVVIPKSANPDRVRENFAVTDFTLDVDDMDAIAAMDRGQRIGPDPDKFG
jgi:2,5-diketo-D-gluconate reductase A